jgi:hypothetical protein
MKQVTSDVGSDNKRLTYIMQNRRFDFF